MPQDVPTVMSGPDPSLWPDRVKVLFIGVNDDAGQLRLAREHRAIQQSLESWSDRFEFAGLLEVQVHELGPALRRRCPHVLHFSGHGTRTGELVFQSGSGSPASIPVDAFVSLLRALGVDIKLAILNACFSEDQARAVSEITGIAIGMRRQISDRAAIAFSRAFYEALACSASVADAFRQAQAEIRLEKETAGDALVPELFVRPGLDASQVRLPPIRPQVVAPAPGPQRAREPRPVAEPGPPRSARLDHRWLRGLLVALFAAAGALGLVLWRSASYPHGFAIKVLFVDKARQSVKIAGTVRLESGAYTPPVRVEGSDMATFDSVPQRLDGSEAGFTVDSPMFRVAARERRYPLRSEAIIVLELEPIATKVSGTVNVAGMRLSGGEVSLAGHDCSAPIRNGYFELSCADVRLPVKIEVHEPPSYAGRICVHDFEVSEPTNNALELGPCGPPAAPPAPRASPVRPPPPPCLRSPEELIQREAGLVQQGDLTGVVGLFAPGATVHDVLAGTRQAPRERYRDELQQHRFLTAVHGDIACESTASTAFCTSSSRGTFDSPRGSSTVPGYDNPAGSDRWMLEKRNGCWRIQGLTINAAVKQP